MARRTYTKAEMESQADKLIDEFRSSRRVSPGAKPCVYFIRAGAGPIKIGFTTDIKRRLPGLQTSTPKRLRVLAVMPGRIGLERAMHQRFQEHRIAGEWFRPAPELLAFIKGLR